MEISTRQTNENKRLGRVIIQTNEGKKTKGGRSRWDFAQIADPYSLTFRCVRVRLDTGEFETLVTDLPSKEEDPVYGLDADDLKALYFRRWGLELAYREIKYAHALINVHSRKIESIQQEVLASLIMYNFTNLIARAVPVEQTSRKLEYTLTAASYCCASFRSRLYQTRSSCPFTSHQTATRGALYCFGIHASLTAYFTVFVSFAAIRYGPVITAVSFCSSVFNSSCGSALS